MNRAVFHIRRVEKLPARNKLCPEREHVFVGLGNDFGGIFSGISQIQHAGSLFSGLERNPAIIRRPRRGGQRGLQRKHQGRGFFTVQHVQAAFVGPGGDIGDFLAVGQIAGAVVVGRVLGEGGELVGSVTPRRKTWFSATPRHSCTVPRRKREKAAWKVVWF